MAGGHGIDAYTKTKISTTTTQQELIVMAYDGILRFLRIAKDAMEKGEIEATHVHLTKSRALIEELATTLNKEKGGIIAENLWNLYIYFMQKITQANFTKDSKHIDDILPPITELRDAWAEVKIPEDDRVAQAANKTMKNQSTSHVSITG